MISKRCPWASDVYVARGQPPAHDGDRVAVDGAERDALAEAVGDAGEFGRDALIETGVAECGLAEAYRREGEGIGSLRVRGEPPGGHERDQPAVHHRAGSPPTRRAISETPKAPSVFAISSSRRSILRFEVSGAVPAGSEAAGLAVGAVIGDLLQSHVTV